MGRVSMLGKVIGRIFIVSCFQIFVFSSIQAQDFQQGLAAADTMEISNPIDSIVEGPMTVQANIRYDYVPDFSEREIRDRIKFLNETSTVKLSYNEKVAGFINYFSVRNREYTRMVIQRQNLYFPLFEKYLNKHNLPDELKYLAIVESGLNPKAGSRVGALGLWQFMPATGKLFKLEQDLFIDERMDPEKSTEAACLYLKELYGMYKDWGLALASYNCGPGTLRRALRKSKYKGDFWEVYAKLPKETRSYFPQFIAVMYTMNFAVEHNLMFDSLNYPMQSDTVLLSNFVNLETFAKLSDICIEDLTKLNPELKRNVIPPYAKNYPLRIPADRKMFVNENIYAILDSASKNTGFNVHELIAADQKAKATTKSKTVHKVRSGEVLGSIAAKYNVKVSDIKTWNKLRSSTIRIGQNLVIWRNQQGAIKTSSVASSEKKVDAVKKTTSKPVANTTSNLASAKKPISKSSTKQVTAKPNNKVYVVQPGDTLWTITQKSGVSLDKIKKMNNLKTNNIKPGQKLVIG